MASNFHEGFEARDHIKTSSDRAFGLTVGGVLAAIGLLRWLSGDGEVDWAIIFLLAVGATLVALGVVAPAALAPLNKAWTKLGLLMFKVVNPVVTFVIFAVAVVPVGLAMRLAGRDPLRLRPDPDARSYWIERSPPGPAPETMKDVF